VGLLAAERHRGAPRLLSNFPLAFSQIARINTTHHIVHDQAVGAALAHAAARRRAA
jgi:hypothetical protein